MRRLLVLFCFVTASALFAPPAPATAAPGDLDPAFGVNGISLVSFGPGLDLATDMFIQPDGKYLLTGTHTDITGTVTLPTMTRFDADGSPDTGFGTDGRLLGVSGEIVFVDPLDGGILIKIGGQLTRLLADGSPDTSYGTDGVLSLAVDGELRILPSGAMLVGGAMWTPWGGSDVAVHRLKADGTVDTSFGTDGRFTRDVVNGSSDDVGCLALAHDGGIFVGGSVQGDGLLLKLTPQGVLDTTFGEDGIVITPAYHWMDTSFEHITELANEKLLTGDKEGSGLQVLSRFLPDGRRDATYGLRPDSEVPEGIVALMWLFPSGRGALRQYVTGTDGAVILAGSKDSRYPTYNDLWLARINANGTLDTGFGTTGQVITDLGGADDAAAVGIDAAGRLLVAGYARPTAPTGTSGRAASRSGQGFARYKGGPSTQPSRPAISSLSPLRGKRGRTVTIVGKNFGKRRGTGSVAFGKVKCRTYVSWNDSFIKCRIPATTRVGWTRVYVTNKGGTGRSLQRFAVQR